MKPTKTLKSQAKAVQANQAATASKGVPVRKVPLVQTSKKTTAEKAKSAPPNEVLEQMADPQYGPLVGLLDRDCRSIVRRQVTSATVTTAAGQTDLCVCALPDPVRHLGIQKFQTTSQTTTYTTAGNLIPGSDPINGLSAITLGSAASPTSSDLNRIALAYGGAGANSDTVVPQFVWRFVNSPLTEFGQLNSQAGNILPCNEYGVLDLGEEFAIAGGSAYVSCQLQYNIPGNTADDSVQRLQYASSTSGPWTTVDSQTKTHPVDYLEIYAYGGSAIPAGNRYLRILQTSAPKSPNAYEIRSLRSVQFELSIVGAPPTSYDFDSIPDIATFVQNTDSYRCCGMEVWVQDDNSLVNNQGIAVGNMITIGEAFEDPKTLYYSNLASKDGFHQDKGYMGQVGIWSTKGEETRRFKAFGSRLPSTDRGLFVSFGGLTSGQSYRVNVFSVWEMETTVLAMGPEERKALPALVELAEQVMSARTTAFCSNDWHEDVINGLKNAGDWLMAKSPDILRALTTASQLAGIVAAIAL